MTYEAILTALADPTRRAVLDRLRGGTLPVARIAEGLPVSRPAVSQHLRILLEAGLVSRTAKGTSNRYALVPGGAAPLVRWLGDLEAEPGGTGPVAIRSHASTIGLPPAEAWRLFCDDFPVWWPVARFSLSALNAGQPPRSVRLDATVGASLREVLFDGTEGTWATVTAVDCPARLDLAWTLGTATPVSVRFVAGTDGCRVTIELGTEAPEAVDFWDIAMERFAAAANAKLADD